MSFDASKHLRKLPKGGDYLEVKWRLCWVRDEHPDWGIHTKPLHLDVEAGVCIYQATVCDGAGQVLGMGTKMETARGFGDYVEKAETGSIGRALAVCGYGTQFTGDELAEGERIVDAPVTRSGKGAPTVAAGNAREPQQHPAAVNTTAQGLARTVAAGNSTVAAPITRETLAACNGLAGELRPYGYGKESWQEDLLAIGGTPDLRAYTEEQGSRLLTLLQDKLDGLRLEAVEGEFQEAAEDQGAEEAPALLLDPPAAKDPARFTR